jgi:hypothetical protein
MLRTLLALFLTFVAFCFTATAGEHLPPPLVEAFTKIDAILSDEVKTTLKQKDPEQARIDPFGDNITDITNEKTYDNLQGQLVAKIERELGLGIRHPAVGRLPRHPKIEEFFTPYLVSEPGTQAVILLELYVKHLRGMPTEWEKRLIQFRDLNVLLLEGAWDQLMQDIQTMDPAVSKPLIMKMRALVVDAEKQIAEQPGTEQPATRPVDEPEGGYKPQPEAEGRSR